MKQIKNQQGALVLEIGLVVIAIAALGFAFYTVTSTRNKLDKQTETKPAVQVKQPASLDDAAAADFVKMFYQKYIDSINSGIAKGSSGDTGQKALVQQYGDAALVGAYSWANDYDPILCAQNTVSKFSITSHKSVSAKTANVNVSRDGYDDGDVVFTVVANGSSLQIDKVECPIHP